MNEKEYSVSEAVRLIGVESHVLRYWEEELAVEIKRSSQGHRIYTKENIETFCRVKTLKEKGIQLKAIRALLTEQKNGTRLQADIELFRQVMEAAEIKENAKEEQRRSETFEQAGARTLLEEEAAEWRELEEAEAVEQRKSQECERSERSQLQETESADQKKSLEKEQDLEKGAVDIYEIVEIEKQPDHLQKFEEILKRILEEVVAEQNEKLELTITGVIREEIDDLYVQYDQIMCEAAATMTEKGRKRKGRLAKLLEWLI